MNWLKYNWMPLVGFLCMFAAIYLMALKINQIVRKHNGFVYAVEERLQRLEVQAALWEMRENDKLADGR